jgi:hypothetical protein
MFVFSFKLRVKLVQYVVLAPLETAIERLCVKYERSQGQAEVWRMRFILLSSTEYISRDLHKLHCDLTCIVLYLISFSVIRELWILYYPTLYIRHVATSSFVSCNS